ncbi:MAG: hypothetical protein JJE39_08185 [Vicinamibacteria bacterium]|nr:hypothetical protein [Vicinamibacteria bacterium]
MSDPASHLTVRRIPPALASALSRERKRRKASLNSTVIGLLNHALGVEATESPRSNGLAKLAGTWTSRDATAFERATLATRQVDEELWR